MSDRTMATAENELTKHAEAESGTYKPSEHDGLKQDGTPDKRVKPDHGFGGDKELAHEAGVKGGKVGQEQMAYE